MAIYRVSWRNSAIKELRKIDRQAIPRVVAAVDELAEDPYAGEVRKLRGYYKTFRKRVGDYRIVFTIQSDKLVIEIIRVRHRKDVYED